MTKKSWHDICMVKKVGMILDRGRGRGREQGPGLGVGFGDCQVKFKSNKVLLFEIVYLIM